MGDDVIMFLQRLTLECGHHVLWGPWETDGQRRYVGQITFCDLCPKSYPASHPAMAMRVIVSAVMIPLSHHRKPSAELQRVRDRQLAEEATHAAFDRRRQT